MSPDTDLSRRATWAELVPLDGFLGGSRTDPDNVLASSRTVRPAGGPTRTVPDIVEAWRSSPS